MITLNARVYDRRRTPLCIRGELQHNCTCVYVVCTLFIRRQPNCDWWLETQRSSILYCSHVWVTGSTLWTNLPVYASERYTWSTIAEPEWGGFQSVRVIFNSFSFQHMVCFWYFEIWIQSVLDCFKGLSLYQKFYLLCISKIHITQIFSCNISSHV